MPKTQAKPAWDAVPLPHYPQLTQSEQFDVVVVGGGITGLSAAYFLKQAGKRVCVLERDRIGSGDTGHTTAHLTCITDARLAQLVKTFGEEHAALAWHAGNYAMDVIEQVVQANQLACEFRRVPAFLHAAQENDEADIQELLEEAELAGQLGFDVTTVQRVPIVDRFGMCVRNQAKFHPRAYLSGLAALVDGQGSKIYEQTEVSTVEDDPLAAVTSEDVRVACDFVVIATHVPLVGKSSWLSSAFLQSRLAAYSSYVVSGRLPAGAAPDLSLWDTADPYNYLRVDSLEDGVRVVLGGKDHKTGQETNTDEHYRQLEEMLLQLFPTARLEHRWSGQVIKPHDGLPFIGESSERQFIACGYNGNGITFGTIAGLMARDAMLNRENPWQELFSLDRKRVRGAVWEYFKENLDYPYYLLADRLTARTDGSAGEIASGTGKVLKLDGQRVACARDESGQLHQVSAVCTHLGCLVRWNSAEQTWDCPCHGSRFHPTGEVLAGPAESPLSPVELAAGRSV
jgi:glycine/D-amino acid oxidase-like deaminating enzyme/nitrite reductase/ring-hydroxylating ferredoxin subunit